MKHTQPKMPCPRCGSRIGNARGTCLDCNRFAQALARRVSRLLRTQHPEEAAQIRSEVESAMYHEMIRRSTP